MEKVRTVLCNSHDALDASSCALGMPRQVGIIRAKIVSGSVHRQRNSSNAEVTATLRQ